MRRFPHGGEVLGASPANPLLAPVLRPEMVLSRQQALLDLQAIQRIPGLAGYWSTDPAYLFEDSAGTIPANTDGTGVVGYWRRAGAAPVYTPVAIINGTFDTDIGWYKDAGWSIADGVATKTAGGVGNIYQGYSFAAGTAYRISFTVTRTSGTGGVQAYLFGGTTVFDELINASGSYQRVIIAATGNNVFGFIASSTFAGTIDNVVVESIANWGASQATTTKKPILRRTPTSNVYWLNSDTDDELTATLGNLGAACTVAKSGAEGVTFTEGVTISSTYNIAPAYGFNGDVAIFNRALTASEKALLTRYMQRGVPRLGANLVTNGTFDTDTTGWTKFGADVVEVVAGELQITRITASTSVYQAMSTGSNALLFSGSVETISGTGSAILRVSSNSSLNNYDTIYLSASNTFVSKVFVPPIATIYVNCAATTAPCVTQFDDISVRPIL